MDAAMNTIVKITWRDARHPTDEWSDIDNLEITDNIIYTYGTVVKQDEHNILVAQCFSREDNRVTGVFTITKRQVMEIETLVPGIKIYELKEEVKHAHPTRTN